MRGELERLCGRREVPPAALETFLARVDELDFPPSGIDPVLSPSLAFLEGTVATLEVEPHTAFVVMPFHQPYAERFAPFYRAALESVGYRAFRAWGGLSWEDYCGLLVQLIAKSGLVLAELSEHSSNVFYEIGVAHALGKVTCLSAARHRPRGGKHRRAAARIGGLADPGR